MPLGVPSFFQLGLLASQIPLLEQSLFAPLKTTSSGFLKLVGEGFDPYIYMYPHSVQAGLIIMLPEPIHYENSDGVHADTSPLQSP